MFTNGVVVDKEINMAKNKFRLSDWFRKIRSSIDEWFNPRQPVPVPIRVRNQNQRR